MDDGAQGAGGERDGGGDRGRETRKGQGQGREERERTALPRDMRSRDVAVGTHTVCTRVRARLAPRYIYFLSCALVERVLSALARCSSQRDA